MRAAPLVTLVVGAALGAGGALVALGRPGPGPRAVTPRGPLVPGEQATIDLFARLAPSVVSITTLAVYRDALTLNANAVPQGAGSGFVWDDAGHVVTNFHVVAQASAVQVTLDDHTTWPARLVGAAPEKDLALLRIEAPADALHPIPVGTSADLQVGQAVFAIGNPFGLDHSLTTGIVSALGRTIESVGGREIEGVIQTDASINPGNSGGPLLDSAGRLVGINTAIQSPSGASAGIGFAVPVDTVNRVVPQLLRHGRLVRPRLGVNVASDAIARRLRLEGLLVLSVDPDGPAADVGLVGTRRDPRGRLLLGDVLRQLDDRPLRSADDLLLALEQHDPGATVRLVVERAGALRTVQVTLEAPR
ncbi:MAG: trypsin-like peptidase domain-containing protein [Myxococcales bacterium]|nr:trypsin-like peptidase domain-containing protein [Myxococcales bacterium]